MRMADQLLEDEQLLDTVYEAQGKRHPQSRNRGRMQTPAEVLLRLLLLKHIRNWGYDVLEREVRANLEYRAFTRIGDEKVPDAKTLARLGQLMGAKVIEDLQRRVVALTPKQGVPREASCEWIRRWKKPAFIIRALLFKMDTGSFRLRGRYSDQLMPFDTPLVLPAIFPRFVPNF
jgi:Transposase domain (DUF772)